MIGEWWGIAGFLVLLCLPAILAVAGSGLADRNLADVDLALTLEAPEQWETIPGADDDDGWCHHAECDAAYARWLEIGDLETAWNLPTEGRP